MEPKSLTVACVEHVALNAETAKSAKTPASRTSIWFKSLLHMAIAGISAIAITTAVLAEVTTIPATRMFPSLVGIKLTNQQESRLNQLSSNLLNQARGMLNPQQKTQIERGLQQGKSLKDIMPSLNLSLPQMLKLQQMANFAQGQIPKILTPKQEQQRQQNIRTLSR